MTPRFWVVVGACLLALSPARAFIWPIDHHFGPNEFKFTFSELFMFSTAGSPLGLHLHEPLINVNVRLYVDPREANKDLLEAAAHAGEVIVHTVVFRVPSSEAAGIDMNAINAKLQTIANEADICNGHMPDPASNIVHWQDPFEWASNQLNAHVNREYDVQQSGVQSVIMEVCWKQAGLNEAEGTHLDGKMTFQNPYGYLSGIYYGYLPFEGIRAAAFVVFATTYMILLIAFRDNLIRVHYFIMTVIAVAALEATVSFASYVDMNENGEPYCCPFPGAVVASMLLEVLRRTLSRVLLLLICMGYGVVRVKLAVREWVAVSFLSMCYLASSIVVDVIDVHEINDLHRATAGHNLWWDFPMLLFDLSFLVWIYLALVNTMANLKEQQQSVKLEMYSWLSYVMVGFVLIVSVLTLVIVLARARAFVWPWQLYWVQTVAWDVLNLAVLIALTIIWAPDERSKLLATSQQLATSEDDPGDFSIEGAFDIEMTDQGESDEELDDPPPDEIYNAIPQAADQLDERADL